MKSNTTGMELQTIIVPVIVPGLEKKKAMNGNVHRLGNA